MKNRKRKKRKKEKKKKKRKKEKKRKKKQAGNKHSAGMVFVFILFKYITAGPN